MTILIFIFAVLLIFQVLLGIASSMHKARLSKKYAYALSDLVDASETLQKYTKIHRKVDIKVNAQIIQPALGLKDIVLINRNDMYKQDLYTNFFLITQLELTKKMYRYLREMYILQNLLFALGILLFVLGVSLEIDFSSMLVTIAIILHSVTLALTTFGFLSYDFMLEEVLDIAIDLLNLSELEEARASRLAQAYKYRVFEYPLDIPLKLFYFFKP